MFTEGSMWSNPPFTLLVYLHLMANHAGKNISVLVVEDETALAEAMRYHLEREGYRVEVAGQGDEAIERFRTKMPNLVLLDLMLPGMSGLDVCRLIRNDSNVPILMVTAKDTEADKVAGLEMGADDYITKPFSMRELISRVRAHLRRALLLPEEIALTDTKLAVGPIIMDVEKHEVYVSGIRVGLPPKEFTLLEAMMRRAGKLVTRDVLLSEVWGDDYYGDTRTLDVHIKRLRTKIEPDPKRPRLLKTIRGLGYKLEVTER